MRINSYSAGYGNSVFDVRIEFQKSKSKTKKIIVYFILSSFVFYIIKVVLKLNSLVFMDIIEKAIRGDSINIDHEYVFNISKKNKVIAFLFSAYLFLKENVIEIKEYICAIFKNISKLIFNFAKEVK